MFSTGKVFSKCSDIESVFKKRSAGTEIPCTRCVYHTGYLAHTNSKRNVENRCIYHITNIIYLKCVNIYFIPIYTI